MASTTGVGALCLLVMLLSACGNGLRGTYEDEMELTRLRFDGRGKVVQSSDIGGIELQMRYEMDGDRIRLINPQAEGAVLILTRIDDDTLSGPMGITLKRVSDP
ncbi:hypothetical protein [Pseudoxanthomonas wuyuanensis]|uniref:Uncharacterized protein n=1 Tax=Pseudoxanthomonas wuyuanensis TaxID=1073196 RepID=A0A286D5Z1_9GAMM|nr:hypothetical protein [Pseudoxanthomonas wuyuanensis]KAF1719216.1 hypothetical protein CSC75_16040 [Pseudoxanthomonas wuyuanensis]SOD54014.1 hypothetical protein SAMN06296416_10344 [Pseudoxanthomonas wuyuanensis]